MPMVKTEASEVLRTAMIDRVGYRGLATRYTTEPS
jgi:hypothetical protein